MRSLILKIMTLASGLAVLLIPLSSLAGGALVGGSAAEVHKRAASQSGFIRVASTKKATGGMATGFAYQPPMRGSASSGRIGGGTRGRISCLRDNLAAMCQITHGFWPIAAIIESGGAGRGRSATRQSHISKVEGDSSCAL